MKRLLILVITVAAVLTLHAQDYLGFHLGFAQSITRLNTPTASTTLNPTTYNGMKVGLVYDATIIEGFGMSMALNYTLGANKSDWQKLGNFSYPAVQNKGLYHQIEIPVDWQYKFEIAKETWIVLYTGPTLQCGLAFNNKQYRTNDGKEIFLNKDKNFYSEDMKDYALKRINVTWGVGAGFQFDRYFIRGGYDFGIINPYKAYQFDQKVGEGNPRTRGRFDQWQIKLGMYLWQF
jgi:hypothetical protein